MRWVVVLSLAAGCRIAVHQSYGGQPAPERAGVVQLLVMPPGSWATTADVAAKLQTTMLSALRQDPHVHAELATMTGSHDGCRYAQDHGMDYIVRLEVEADTTTNVSCRKLFWKGWGSILKDRHEPDPEECTIAPPYAHSHITFEVTDPYHCRKNEQLTHKFAQVTQSNSEDWQPLLDERAATATRWMNARLPHFFAPDIPVIPGAHAGQATLPIGASSGVREGEAFQVFDGRDSAGYVRAEHVTATTTDVVPIYGGLDAVASEHAIARGRPWALEVQPVLGTSQLRDTMTSDTAVLVGGHVRVHPFGSGLVLGAELEGQLANGSSATLLGPEFGWGQQLGSRVGLHVLAGAQLANAHDRGGPTQVGAAGDLVAGVTCSFQHGFVGVEAGYQWSRWLDTIDLAGPIARLTFGLSP
jgi:hypothetical protein